MQSIWRNFPLIYPSLIYRRPRGVVQEDRSTSVTIGVADEHIGVVVGRGGKNLMEISQVPF